MASNRPYSKLTRQRAGVGTYTSLWLGPDHLLLVTLSGFSESYQRFYFRDIRAFVVSDSIRSTVFSAVCISIVAFLGLLAALSIVMGSGSGVGLLIAAAPFFVVLVWNLILGRSCKVTLMSGVQTVPLPPLSRFRRTRRVFARIVPLIQAAQASLTPPPVAAPSAPAPVVLPAAAPSVVLPSSPATPAAAAPEAAVPAADPSPSIGDTTGPAPRPELPPLEPES